MKHDYWLSICIPTYNRSDSLKITIDSIISQEGFDNSIEVIISDNASTDNTYNLVKSYEKYSNIKYYRNKTNLNDYNFILAISYAKGEYIKLLSDNKPLKEKFIINMQKAVKKNPSLIFHKIIDKEENLFVEINSVNEFIKIASFYSTWLPAYTYRKDVLDKIDYKNYDHTTKLVQLIIALKVLEINPNCIFIIGKSMDDLGASRKGGYNIFEVFINNYINILTNNKNINPIVLFNEKCKLLIYFVFNWIYNIFFSKKKKGFYFDTKNWMLIIFKYYWYNPLLYIFPFYIIKLLLKKITKKYIIK